MDSPPPALAEKADSTPLPVSSPGSSVSHPSTTWAGALVALSAMVPVGMALPLALQAYLSADPSLSRKGLIILIALGAVTLGVAAPTSFREVLTVARRYLPGGRQ